MNTDSSSKAGAIWWSPTPDGGIRRIWVKKADRHYFCAREVCDAGQESARARLFDADAAARAPEPDDVRRWAQAQFAQLRTADAAEAWAFLGADDIAQCALLEADPELTPLFPGEAPCADLQPPQRTPARSAG